MAIQKYLATVRSLTAEFCHELTKLQYNTVYDTKNHMCQIGHDKDQLLDHSRVVDGSVQCVPPA